MKRFLSAIAITLVFALLAACGSNPASPAPKSEDPSPAPDSPAAPAITKLVIGLDDQFPPMGFRDDKNELVGFDIDLAKAVCDKLGIEAVPTPIDWSAKEFELNGGKVDVLWNGLTITDARKEAMLLSPAYIANAQVIVVRKDSGIKTLADLSGKTVALQEASSADEAYMACSAAGTEKELVKAPENISLFNDLKIGRIDAVVIDKVFGDYYIAENGEGLLEILEEQLADEEYGIAFKKDNQELADLVLGALDELVKDGTAAQISQKWFGEDRILFSYTK
ncbi:MAG: amino acid ABC transporter substrate-binding protein [Angelakisella sp.]|jgi:polar amino acid transport system substrate-binding protein|nr:amino acid ABC transporter substrate-binding protein [Angelakisella sp.]